MHKIPYGETQKKWDEFVDLLFSKPVFREFEKTSIQAIKNQYNQRSELFKKKFGWDDGSGRNLSDVEGDLSECDRIIRRMLNDQFTAEQSKKLKDADKETCDRNELTVLIRGIGESSNRSMYLMLKLSLHCL